MEKPALLLLSIFIAIGVSCSRDVVYLPVPDQTTADIDEPPTPPQDASHIRLVSIPGGSFLMGDVENLGGARGGDEKPVHTVRISGFEMGATEITNDLYVKYLNRALETGDITIAEGKVKGRKGPYRGLEYIDLNGSIADQYPGNRCWITYSDSVFQSDPKRGGWPVVYVTWFGALAFARYYALDLPTEAEWEYACRGGRQYPFGTDDGLISTSKANFNSTNGTPVEAGNYSPNPFGLYDMSGNVWEWCLDRYGPYPQAAQTDPTGSESGIFRLLRGGSWNLFTYHCRAADRNIDIPFGKADYLGFRVVRRP